MPNHNTVYIREQNLVASEQAFAAELDNPGWQTMAEGVFDRPMPEDQAEKLVLIESMVTGFDSRDGKSRDEARPNLALREMIKSSERTSAFEQASIQLGQRGTTAPEFKADSFVIAGAKVEATLARLLHAQRLGAKSLTLVGIRRELGNDELTSMEKLFPELEYEQYGRTEAGAMRGMIDYLYPEAAASGDEIMDKSAEKDVRGNGGGKFSVFFQGDTRIYWAEAPVNLGLPILDDDNYLTTRKPDIASTAETLQFLGEYIVPGLGNKISIATNDVYRFMGVDAKHVLEGVHGFSKTALATVTPEDAAKLLNKYLEKQGSDHRIDPKVRTEDVYAQEIRSIQRSLKRWHMNIRRSRANYGLK